ncbi:MAG: lamin tail domain-containing protein, partial [Myxococcota bacterium]
AGVEDGALVLRGGEVLSGDAALVEALETGCNVVGDVCGSEKRVCLQREIGMSFADLQTAVGDIYPLFACGVPENEPTCVPARTLPEDTTALGSGAYQSLLEAEDIDGDGIANDEDNCDTIFNPIRPLDDGQQADADGDGTGDACDPCPLNEGFTCAGLNPDDLDADGANDTTDNCPGLSNADQADGDGDGKGDACDICPDAANPGTRGCPATVYAVKTDAGLEGQRVSLQGLVVTSVIGNGFFAQLDPTSAGYAGADHSGVFFYTGAAPTVTAGDVLDVSGATVASFFGQVQLTGASFETVSTAAVPAPYGLAAGNIAAAVAQGEASPLEGLFVELQDVTVTDAAPAPGAGDATGEGEFEVTGGMRVDDVAYLIEPAPTTGENFAFLRGPVAWRNGHLKLLPRSADDVAAGDNEVASLGPAPVFVRVGATGALGDALEVRLNRTAEEATTIEILSGDDAVATVAGGTVVVATGTQSATVPVQGIAAGTTTLRARRQGSAVERTVEVRVLAADAPAAVAALSPTSTIVAVEGSQVFTVTLDIPAPAGGASIELAVTGGIGTVEVGGSAASTLVIAADAFEGTFTLVAGAAEATGTVTATLGASAKSADVTVVDAVGGLVINEVDYDNPGADTAEFVEIYNGTGAPVSLAGHSLLFFNGNDNKSYRKVALDGAGTLNAGGFLVVHNGGVTPAASSLRVTQDAAGANLGNDLMQNGAPDGIALVTESDVIDVFAYEGAIPAADGGALGPIDLGDGTALVDEPA